ncbi:MAG: serine/threonine protein kinase [Myxococcales bacterium]|nr:serine/threonine protein kinase [Myxococcales bacterium]
MGEAHPYIGRLLLGKYQLVEHAGVGGMAEVFRAFTLGASGFRRPVAVKRIHDHLSQQDEFVRMFVEEARVVSELQHPNIVQIHDFDKDEAGRYFIVMEWVQGMSLLEWALLHVEHGFHTPWFLVSAVGIEVLKALGAAHGRRDGEGEPQPIYHRDVSPQNILIHESGIIKLADFGLARAMDRARTTTPDVIKGKLSYMAPELTRFAEPSPQSDIFGVGIVLWEVLTGRRLFCGEHPMQIVEAVRRTAVPSLRAARSDIPIALHDIVHRALSQDPNGRFASCREMMRALANILRTTPMRTDADVIAASLSSASAGRFTAATGTPAITDPRFVGPGAEPSAQFELLRRKS